MNVEGLWCFQSTSVENPSEFRDGGVVVLETGRVLGGDSMMAYLGDYEIHGDTIRAKIHSWQWNLAYEAENVFGMKSPNIKYMVDMTGKRDGEMIIGHIAPEGHPEVQLPIRMIFMTKLPG